MSGKQLFLIDGSALAYRSYFAFIRNPLINSRGENTSVSFGVVNSLFSLLNQHDPSHIAIVFDTREPTHRHKKYPEYKSTRAKMPDDMADQLPRMREVVEALNLPMIEKAGVEADDVIGTLAKRAAAENYQVLIVTSDKDFNQLVDDNIKILRPQKAGADLEIIDRDKVVDILGIPPEKVIDFMALTGDTSDNIPGIPGVGPKTALKLLEQFGSLEEVLANADKISGKSLKQKVSENKDKARLSKDLVTILTDLDLDYDIKDLVRSDFDTERLKQLFEKLEFTRFLQELLKDQADQKVDEHEIDYQAADSLDKVRELVKQVKESKSVCLDTETTSLTPIDSKLVGISISFEEYSGYYLPLGHDEKDRNLNRDEVLELLKPVFEDDKIKKIGQNLKYDYQVLANYGIHLKGIDADTMIMSYLINPSARQHNLGKLALEHLDYKMQPITELIGSGKKQKSFSVVPIDKATFYAVEDVDIALRLYNRLLPMIKKSGLEKLFYEIEMPLVEVLAEMESAGVKIDIEYMKNLSTQIGGQIDEMVSRIYEYAGYKFNINSTQQLQKVLFEDLALKPGRKTTKKTGYSTDMQTLEELAKEHPLPKILLEYRMMTKLRSTYIDALPKLVSEATGRLHTSFNQTITATGRLSSSDPNLQNIPVRTEEGAKIRKGFVPRDDEHVLLGADYSQVELRILAHLSKDEKMLEAFQQGEDIHSRTASEVYGIPLDEVTPEMRRMAKTANFAVIYGVSAYGLSMQSDMSVAESKQFIDTYYARYPGIREFMDNAIEKARKDGYVTTLFGRRRHIPEINSKNRQVRQFAERTAMNTPIQGTAADMIKVAMIEIYGKIKEMRSKMILQVHDELIFDVHKDELEQMKDIVRSTMETSVDLDVPVKVDMGIGSNWLECK